MLSSLCTHATVAIVGVVVVMFVIICAHTFVHVCISDIVEFKYDPSRQSSRDEHFFQAQVLAQIHAQARYRQGAHTGAGRAQVLA